jgi:hypothetical protein
VRAPLFRALVRKSGLALAVLRHNVAARSLGEASSDHKGLRRFP